jgi:ATP-dependent DNA helicase DinG
MSSPQQKIAPLDAEKVLEIVGPNGRLSMALPNFESRPEQQAMMKDIIEAYNESKVALIEAGTGTGKSIAYLLPAILWAVQMKERTLISTNTINLQEQLLYKDIPLLKKALNLNIKAVLVKGMGNYVCLRKVSEVQQEIALFQDEETQELQEIEAWSETTRDGSRTDLPFMPKPTVWEKVCAESDTCNRDKCPFYQKCHFFKARKEANDAQLLISNHSLLFSDLAYRGTSENGQGILPDYKRVILDEAHNIEDIATEHFASKANGIQMLRTLARLTADKQGKILGKLSVLHQKLLQTYPENRPDEVNKILDKLSLELPALRRELRQLTVDTFDNFAHFIDIVNPNDEEEDPEIPGNKENKLRLLPEHYQHPHWSNQLLLQTQELIKTLKKFVQCLHLLESDLKMLHNEIFDEQTQGLRLEINALASRLETASETLHIFTQQQIPENKVRWIESQKLRSLSNVNLIDANLDLSNLLVNHLFKRFPTTVLCSATLTTNKQFRFFRERLGLTPSLMQGKPVTESIYCSPFNYKQQSLLAIPTDMPHPSESNFTREAAKRILTAIQASRGNAFILFTSYSMMKQCHQLLEKRLNELRFPVFKQGDNTRKKLISQFIETDRSVLFGTDSFWEGVDVAGEALRCVIITKLPFQVPKEPIIQARMESINAKGGNAFMDYSLPNAIVKFKQGFGRLIRNKKDRGCILCLDSRLVNKPYGKQFINSLPDSQKLILSSDNLQNAMDDFYRSTYHLTK